MQTNLKKINVVFLIIKTLQQTQNHKLIIQLYDICADLHDKKYSFNKTTSSIIQQIPKHQNASEFQFLDSGTTNVQTFFLTFSVDISSSYAFFYNPGFKAIEDGWSLFQPEEEFAKIIHSADSEWRISYANIDYSV